MNRVLVVGKKNHIPWPYLTYRGFLQNDLDVKLFYYNEYTIFDRVKKTIFKKDDSYYKLLINFKPDVVIFVSAFFIPKEYFEVTKELGIKSIGWVGDIFGEDRVSYNQLMDKLYLFDTSLLELAKKLNFNSELLQVGYDPLVHKNNNFNRRDSFNFVASFSEDREMTLSNLKNENLELYGLKWNKLKEVPKSWSVKNKKITYDDLAFIYNSTKYSLNITQRNNVNNGITMRVFETIACGSCLLSDNLKDIPMCFEPEKEILIYNSDDELKYLSEKVSKDKVFYNSIIENAQDRLIKSEYTYKDRAKYMLENIG